MSSETGIQEQGRQLRSALRPRREKTTRAGAAGPRSGVRKQLFPFGDEEPTSAGINGKGGQVGSYYLGNRHELIHRHTESVSLNPDQTARWTLKIDYELPSAAAARCGVHNGEALFVFPLLYLRKAEGRTGFEAQDEQGASLPLLNREVSDQISAEAAARSAIRLLDEARAEDMPDLPVLPTESVEYVFECICSWRAYRAAVILNKLLNDLDERIVQVWEEAGLIKDLELLVDHSLVWVPMRGLPEQHRAVTVAHDIELSRRPLVRWHFGELKRPRFGWLKPRRRRRIDDESQVLNTGKAKYGRTAWRLSLSVLGERLAQPLGMMPIEFDFPTIYTHRCGSYHFEMECPRGLSPRGVKVASDEEKEPQKIAGRKTYSARAAHVYLPKARELGDVQLRATVGVSTEVFPMLWVLMGVITTMMLWALVAFNPNWLVAGDTKNHNEIAAGVLLIVPALLGALVVGSDESAESGLISGVRILLLVTGLCCAAATGVLIGVEPFSSKPQATWAVCAAVATAATIPLATSWLLSLPSVWRARRILNSVLRQYVALGVLTALAFGLALLLTAAGGDTVRRAALASSLLGLTVALLLLASNRLPVSLEANRKFVSVGAVILAAACTVLGCVELQRIFAPNARWQIDVESVERWIVLIAPATGLLLWVSTLIFRPRRDELSIAPKVGRALIAEERIRELRKLRELASKDRDDLPGRVRQTIGRLRR